jgi:peptidyl-prolyl cis-trans isomerase SurA
MIMNNRKIYILLFLIFNSIFSCCYAASLPTMSSSIDKIVIIVNGDVITQSEVNQAMLAAKQELMRSNTKLPSDADLRKQVMDNLINLSIERQMIKQANIVVSDSDLNNAIESIAKSNNITVAELKAAVEKSGMKFAQYRKQISSQIQLSQLEQGIVGRDITVSDQEVKDFLSKNKNLPDPNAIYHLENILVPFPSAPSPEDLQKAKAQAMQIMQQLRKGKDFGQVAAAESGGATALRGGDLGWRQLPELPTVFADTVKNMHPGEIAGPLQAPNGFHIIKLIAVKGSAVKLDDQKVRSLIYRRKFEEQLQTWLKQARDAAYIQYMN